MKIPALPTWSRWLVVLLVVAGCKPATPIRETRVRAADGSQLFVRVIGDGADTVVVLHGGPGLHSGYLIEPLQRLADGRTFVLYDQRGRGKSTASGGDSAALTVHDDVNDLEALRSALKLSRFSVVAHHYGALVAVDYALAHPARVRRLLLVGPMVPRALYRYDLALHSSDARAVERYRSALERREPIRDPIGFCRRYWGFFLGSERETNPAVTAALAPGMCDTSAFGKARVDNVNARVTTALGAWDYRATAARLTAPVLVVFGHGNKILTHAARTWAYKAPHGRMLMLPGAPQFPWIGAERHFTAAADAFLAGRWPDGSERPSAEQTASPDDSSNIVSSTAPGPAESVKR